MSEKIKRQTGHWSCLPKVAKLRSPHNKVKRPTPVFLNLDWAAASPAHAPATSAFRNGGKVNCQNHFLPSGPSIEGIAFVSRAIMTGRSHFYAMEKLIFLSVFYQIISGVIKNRDPGNTCTPAFVL